MSDRGCKIVGLGPRCGLTTLHTLPKPLREDLLTLVKGDEVDLLLDGGEIVRGFVRAVRHWPRRPHWRLRGRKVWVTGVVGSCALARVRRPRGWAGVEGCHYLNQEHLQVMREWRGEHV